jgi:hypothetical protein
MSVIDDLTAAVETYPESNVQVQMAAVKDVYRAEVANL